MAETADFQEGLQLMRFGGQRRPFRRHKIIDNFGDNTNGLGYLIGGRGGEF
jgi:hypothetical protein